MPAEGCNAAPFSIGWYCLQYTNRIVTEAVKLCVLMTENPLLNRNQEKMAVGKSSVFNLIQSSSAGMLNLDTHIFIFAAIRKSNKEDGGRKSY